MITQYLIRSGNLRQIYQLIDQNIGISRARLAKITKLSKTTVSSLVDELIAGGYVLDACDWKAEHILHVVKTVQYTEENT